jgi:hypothetical protein
MTSPSAVGVIIGTGNVGKHLKQRSNVFLSADAGVSWHQVSILFIVILVIGKRNYTSDDFYSWLC